MREIIHHRAGRIFLAILLVSMLGLLAAVWTGALDAPEGEVPFLWFGWMVPSLTLGILFVTVWLVAYLVYFSFFWPYR